MVKQHLWTFQQCWFTMVLFYLCFNVVIFLRIHGVAKSRTQLSNWTECSNNFILVWKLFLYTSALSQVIEAKPVSFWLGLFLTMSVQARLSQATWVKRVIMLIFQIILSTLLQANLDYISISNDWGSTDFSVAP